jgi:hypothetical protein
MSIEQKDVIDSLGIDNSTGEAVLTMFDPLEWSGHEHLLLLQEKLNTYLAFVESGEIFDTYPDAKDSKIRIDLTCRYNPNEKGINFLNQVKGVIEGTGMKFNYQIK